MTTVVVTLTSVCAGGNHLAFSLTGAKSATVQAGISDLTDPITDDDAVVFCKVIARMARSGRTLAQANALLQAGVTVTV